MSKKFKIKIKGFKKKKNNKLDKNQFSGKISRLGTQSFRNAVATVGDMAPVQILRTACLRVATEIEYSRTNLK